MCILFPPKITHGNPSPLPLGGTHIKRYVSLLIVYTLQIKFGLNTFTTVYVNAQVLKFSLIKNLNILWVLSYQKVTPMV